MLLQKLTQEFFHLLVDYEYRPKYKEGVHSFSRAVVSGLTRYLGTPKVASDISGNYATVLLRIEGLYL